MRFFKLIPPENLADSNFVRWSDDVDLEQIECTRSKSHYRAGKRIGKLKIVIPNNKDDILWTWHMECLVSDKVVNLLQANSISGYQLEDIIVEEDKRKAPHRKKLYELVIKGRAHLSNASGYKILEECIQCGFKKVQHVTNGLIIDESSWDKSCFFSLFEYPKFILTTEKVKLLFEKNNITGCDFIDAVKYKVNW